ncbi:MAG: glycoside hydrolase family 3 protein [Steroidobacter sp.]
MFQSKRRGARLTMTLAFIAQIITVCGCSPNEASQPTAPTQAPSVVHPDRWPSVERPPIDDSGIEQRLEALMDALSVEEKVGQIVQADIGSVTPEDVRKYRLGSVLNGGNSAPGGDDLAPARVWLDAADAFYAASMDTTDGRHAVPILWGVDAVHGHNNIIGATLFPHNVALGATRNPDLMRRIGEITARELRVTGQEWTFAPTIAVVQDVRWGRAYESYSESPAVVREYTAAIIKGLQGEVGDADFLRGDHVIATAKHYIADGGTFEGRDQGDARASEEELREIHGSPYPVAIATGVQAVMTSFSSWQGRKIHGHKGLLTDVLKDRMGFEGFVVGDWNAHGQVEGCTNASCAAAINAGLDMFMAPDSWRELYENTLVQVRSGEIPMPRLNDAVRRILRVKLRSGLFEAGKPSTRAPAGQFDLLGSAEHRAVARQAVRESLVLLKNSDHLLPLQPGMNVLVAGDGADSIAKQNGGWTLSWQGTGVTNAHFPHAESIFSGIRSAVKVGGGRATLSIDGEYRARPDVAIVVFGEDPYAEFQGDVDTLEYQPADKSDLDLLRKFKADGVPVVSVFLSGRPMWVNPELNASDAFIAAWLPGSEGGGVADVLFAKADGSVNHDFKGRLPFAWPRTTLQTTAAPGSQPPLFAFGFGLSYGDEGSLPMLSEDKPPSSGRAAARIYFASGKPGQGWQLVAGEPDKPAVALEGATGSSPGNALRIVAVDHATQEDARLATWSGDQAATLALRGAAPVDLQREANGQLSLAFDYRVDAAPTAGVELAVECGVQCRGAVPIQSQLRSAPRGEWRQFKMLLQCFQKSGADMRNITAPFTLATSGALQLRFANVRLDTGLSDVIACN